LAQVRAPPISREGSGASEGFGCGPPSPAVLITQKERNCLMPSDDIEGSDHFFFLAKCIKLNFYKKFFFLN
jgi:hypothetical protein